MEKGRKYHNRYCIAYGCLNSNKKKSDLSLFSLPKDDERRRVWLTSIGREDLLEKEHLMVRAYEVCAEHFDDSSIKTMKHLKNDAVPTKLLPTIDGNSRLSSTYTKSIDISSSTKPNTSDDKIKKPKTVSVKTQTKLTVSTEETIETLSELTDKTPQKRKLLKDLQESNYKLRRLNREFEKVKKELEAKNRPVTPELEEDDISRRFQKLVEWQNKIKNKSKGNRYDAEYKVFTLNLFYSSPQAYRCLQTVLKLPSKSTIHRFKFKITPKLNDRVLNSLLMKMKSMPQKAIYCSICVDEIVLKRNLYYDVKADEIIGFHNINGNVTSEIASNAYVLMLQGINFNWKQPIAYALLAGTKHYAELDVWINEVIEKLFGVGIEVRAIISDQGSDFDNYSKQIKQVTVDNPYFYVGERKIYYIFDVPHLIRCVRNDLLSSNFQHEGNVVSWEYIKTLYEEQKDKNLRLIPKIKYTHVHPNNLQRMKVKYAAQIFSGTVHAALETYIDFGKISEEARATAKFVKIMNDLFDVLNSCKVKSMKKLKTAFRMSKDQTTILENAQNMFAGLQSTDRKTGKVNKEQNETFVNFQITIQSILKLYDDLKVEGFQYLFTRRLNQESLKNFFASLRQQSGCCAVPTPFQFTRAFSKLFLTEMLKSSQSANCESLFDINKILMKAEDIISTEIISPDEETRKSLVEFVDGETDYQMDLPEANALTYVAAYLVFKCSKQHGYCCEEMLGVLKRMPSLDQIKLYSHYKAFNKNASFYGSLKMPPQELIQYVEKLETTFTNNFINCIQTRPGSTIFETLKQIPPTLLCQCFPIDYFLRLFVRFRIFEILRFNNRCFKTGKKSTTQYLLLKQIL